jgi:hypothetical protein
MFINRKFILGVLMISGVCDGTAKLDKQVFANQGPDSGLFSLESVEEGDEEIVDQND